MPVFKQHVRGILRTLTLRHLAAAQESDPAITYLPRSTQEIFAVAVHVTKIKTTRQSREKKLAI